MGTSPDDFPRSPRRRLPANTFAAVVTFTLPALVAVIGVRLDRSILRNDPTYAALIPFALCGSVILAAAVPLRVIERSTLSSPQRVGWMVAVICLLVLECGLTGYIVLMQGLR